MFCLQMKAEFGRVVGQKDIVKEMTKKFKNSWQTKITTLAQKRKVGSDLFSEAEDIISTEPDKKSGMCTHNLNDGKLVKYL